MRPARVLPLLLLSLAAAAPASAESDASAAIGLPGTLGLTGFMDMVDARTPSAISVRGGSRYAFSTRTDTLRDTVRLERARERHEFTAYAGGSALGLVDVSLRLPWIYEREEQRVRGVPGSRQSAREQGWGDLDLAGKVSLELLYVDIAPFLHGRFPTGEPSVRGLAEFTYGVAATFSLLNDYLAFHGNLAGYQREKGLSALRYRAGVSFVVWAARPLLVRLFAYGDGMEFEGRARSDLDLELGGQAILFDLITLELGASVRLLDAGHLDRSVRKELRDERGIFARHVDEEGTWAIQLGIGLIF